MWRVYLLKFDNKVFVICCDFVNIVFFSTSNHFQGLVWERGMANRVERYSFYLSTLANKCVGKSDGLFPYESTSVEHDCRQYIACTDEFQQSFTCGNASNGRPLYFNPERKLCLEEAPSRNCIPSK